jgi:ABC-2 type transport system ATP-binding protein
MAVLAIHDAHKAYGSTEALRGASLELREGELLGLLGPNGAGKTTLVRAIAGRVRLDEGQISLFGRPPEDERSQLGVVPQEIALYPLLTAAENLEVFGRIQGLSRSAVKERVAWALGWTGLGERAHSPVKEFSGGMRRRLNIACGVVHGPKVVLLDEPTVGVDPQSRERIYEMLAALQKGGTSLLLTTHHLEEAQVRCERVVILDHGKVVAEGSPLELIEKTLGGARQVTLHVAPVPSSLAGLECLPDGTVRARVHDVALELPVLLERVRAAGSQIQDVDVRGGGLHEVFLSLTGRELRE